ncbi:hypothetical protein Lesp02_73610 [Lentzea sp. NBRC 105346]|uniref:phosphopantetheine-binding protein n=1 Tax=Lentzea sp. NBRC 105346 TaxID=3032205 RepID=UPI0024A3813F|nr:phosphopantetheine-binding protein [Lentzea sp. NBRC 105346]GLZ35174.1 hypothetical protein Lesp02_73610 [Lentzea sp. NBRC 105346]
MTQDIERSLRDHASVGSAAVTVEDDRVVAFVVPAAESLSLRELRTALADTPDEFVVLPALPLAGDGTPDWAELSRSRGDLRRRRQPYVAPRNDMERYLAGLWEDLLGVEDIGADDDFFTLGGHSLLAVRIRMRLQRDHGVTVPPEVLFENSVLHEQAAVVESMREA